MKKVTLSMKQSDTAQRILDSAERLFAQKGFHCTSIRALAHEAHVNLAAINYHFGSKERLLEAVIERRLGPLNQLRMERLKIVRETAARQGNRPRVKDVLLAFIDPTFTFNQSLLDNRSFFTLAGRLFSELDGTARTIFQQKFEPLFSLLLNTMKEALPELPEEVLVWRLHFIIGAMAHTMRVFSNNSFAPDDFSPVADATSMTDMLLAFVTSGMTAPLLICEDP